MGIKDVFGKIGNGLKSGTKFLGDKIKQGYDKVKAKIEFDKLEKTKQTFVLNEFKSNSLPFTIYFKDGKTKEVRCLYDFDGKTLKTNNEIDKAKIDYLKDSKSQEYYIEDIDLNGDVFVCDYNGEELTLPLEKIFYTTKKPIAPIVNQYNITDNSVHDDHSIKAKNSNINSDGSNISNESKLGLHVHLPK